MLAKLAMEGRCTASELGRPFGYAQPTISKHIKVLEKAGLVQREIDGRVHRFSLVREPLDEAENWIKRHQQVWESTLERLEGFVLDGNETKGEP